MNNEITIRELKIEDVDKYKSVRLELLLKEPNSFGSSFEEENNFEESMWNNRLTKKNITGFGAFSDEDLVAIVLAVLNPRKKIKHIATLNSMYVKPAYRKLGIGEDLIKRAVSYLKTQHVEIINLSVASENIKAINLYQKLGFNIYGEEKKAIKLNDDYIDLYLMTKIINS